jgi:hypothetical protein
MRKFVSSIGSTQPMDSTLPYLATRGFGTTRSVGITTSVTRRCSLPPSAGRSDSTFTPRGVTSNFTFGIAPICATNCAPENEPCRIGTWKGSTTFSQCCSQLQGTSAGPPPPIDESSASTNSPGASSSRQS